MTGDSLEACNPGDTSAACRRDSRVLGSTFLGREASACILMVDYATVNNCQETIAICNLR